MASLNASNCHIKCFMYKLGLFCLPFAIAFCFIVSTGVILGELRPYSILHNEPYNSEMLYYPRGTRTAIWEYKLSGVQAHQPQVLIVGSSRGYHIRHHMINRQPNTFYNASVPSADIYETATFIQMLARIDSLPSVILLPLDYPDYNDNLEFFRQNNRVSLDRRIVFYEIQRLWDNLMFMGRKWIDSPLNTARKIRNILFLDDNRLGYLTHQLNTGFLPDGSNYRNDFTPNNNTRRLQRDHDALATQSKMYEPGTNINPSAIAALETILSLGRTHNRTVIGYFPPYRTAYYNKLLNSPDYTYVKAANSEIKTMFEQYDFPLMDFSDVTSIGGSDDELYDSWHPGARLNIRLLIAMTKTHPDILHPYVDVNRLKNDIQMSENPFYVYTSMTLLP